MEAEALVSEIENTEKAYEENQQQNSRMLDQLTESDESTTQLMLERIRAKKLETLLREEKHAMMERLAKLEEKSTLQQNLLQKYETKARLLQEQSNKLNEEVRLVMMMIENQKKATREASQSQAELKSRLDELQVTCSDLKKKYDESVSLLEKDVYKANRLEEEKITLKRKIDHLSLSNSKNESSLEEELKTCKQMIRCSVCNERNKDTVIVKCFHVFCRACIKRNLEIRHRKCPGCNKPFGDNDVHSIFLL
eukprot:TRINITY_DN4301_c0_g1_i1.p1 TRINITY_DN4301_c0_g1~~TRINITY_DN4301_c0_g1_i1.p1  ORF type:complete len:296 (-),score=75.27 TRINITY_DN4301_c0_g1_i1:43-798(-)